ncbi:hypothetical protein MMC13_008243 [Lambiella insularis]|nr:hypothetical protein [Lambiella insularis]
MATIVPPQTWKNGYVTPSETATWQIDDFTSTEHGEQSHYTTPPFKDSLSSTVHNSLGLNLVRSWPTLYNGTESPHGISDWWKPAGRVDVLICGAGPFGLEMALSLVRQGVTFRIIDKAEAPLLSGRADAIQPKSLEILHSWGLAQEFHDEGPILNHTAMFRNGEKMFHYPSNSSDSRYRGLSIISQGQIERIYIRDLLRHQILVERCSVVENFEVKSDSSESHPVRARVKNTKTGEEETIEAKYLVGAEGAASGLRKQLGVPFDGTTTDIYWGIMDCKFETDYPYITAFGIIMSTEHGGCIVVPREDGYTRLYTQLSAGRVQELAEEHRESIGRVDAHSITAEEVLEQTNKIFAPYKMSFASPLSWFAVWKISERVARSFSSPDLRVHLGGDAAVLGAFGLNSSIYDASNLGWKLGLCARGLAMPSSILPTYDLERRLFANRVIRASGAYLRFMCGITDLPLAQLRGSGDDLESYMDDLPARDGTRKGDMKWTGAYFAHNSMLLLGFDVPDTVSKLCPAVRVDGGEKQRPIAVGNGKRAPNPRVCFGEGATGYLYDKMTGAARFHIVVFGSDLQGPVRERIAHFSRHALGPKGFLARFGGASMFNVVLVVKFLPYEKEKLLEGDDLSALREHATVVYDDRSPDEDAGYWYGINHARGAVVAVRPDLWVGTSCWPEEGDYLRAYLEGFLVGRKEQVNGVNGTNDTNDMNDIN